MSAKYFFFYAVAIAAMMLVAFEANCLAQSSSRTSSSNSSSSSSSSMFSQGFSLDSGLSTTTGSGNNSGFIGSSGNTGFVGSSSTGTSSSNRSTSRSSSSGSRGGSSSSRTGGQYGGNSNFNRNTQVQPKYTLGFTPPKRSAEAVSTSLRTRVNHATQTGRLGTMQVMLDEGIATVRGTVANEHDRKVTENMIRLQPGIDEIKSEIQVESAATPINSSLSIRRNQDMTVIPEITTPQGRPLVHVF